MVSYFLLKEEIIVVLWSYPFVSLLIIRAITSFPLAKVYISCEAEEITFGPRKKSLFMMLNKRKMYERTYISYDKPVKRSVKTKEWYYSQPLDLTSKSVWFKRKEGPWIAFLMEQIERFGGEEVTILGHHIDEFGYPVYCVDEDEGQDFYWIDEMFDDKMRFIPPTVEVNPECI